MIDIEKKKNEGEDKRWERRNLKGSEEEGEKG